MNRQVYEKAVDLLSRRSHSTGELHQKLKQRKFSDKDIVPVLRRLEELGFLDDERYAQIYVENMKLYKDWGYYGLKNKLLKKKIASDVAEQALQEFFSLDDELEVAERVVEKLKKKGRKEREKILASLKRKGFRNEVIFKLTT